MLIAMLTLVLFFEYGHGVAGIVSELVGVASIECLAVAEILTQLIGTRPEQNRLFHTNHDCMSVKRNSRV